MTHFVSTFQTAALKSALSSLLNILSHSLLCRLLLPDRSKPRPHGHAACGEQTKAPNSFGQVTGYKYCQMQSSVNQDVLCLTQWVSVRVRLLNTPTSSWCWWSCRALIDDCTSMPVLRGSFTVWGCPLRKTSRFLQRHKGDVWKGFGFSKKIPLSLETVLISTLCCLLSHRNGSCSFNHHFISLRRVSSQGLVSRGF